MNIRHTLFILITAALTLLAAPAFAQGQGDVLRNLVPPPQMIMKHQSALELTDKQKSELKKIIKQAQNAVIDDEFAIAEEAEKLGKLLEATPVDEKKAVAQAKKVMQLETELKTVKLRMLIQTKNVLTPEQLEKIEAFREQRRQERRDRRHMERRRRP